MKLLADEAGTRDDGSVVMTCDAWDSGDYSYVGYSSQGAYGSISRTPYWGSTSCYLISAYMGDPSRNTMYTYIKISTGEAFSSLTVNGVAFSYVSSAGKTYRVKNNVFGMSYNKTVTLTFNPRPTGFL